MQESSVIIKIKFGIKGCRWAYWMEDHGTIFIKWRKLWKTEIFKGWQFVMFCLQSHIACAAFWQYFSMLWCIHPINHLLDHVWGLVWKTSLKIFISEWSNFNTTFKTHIHTQHTTHTGLSREIFICPQDNNEKFLNKICFE